MTDFILFGTGMVLLVASLILGARASRVAHIRRPFYWMYIGSLVGSLALAVALCFTGQWEARVSVNAWTWLVIALPVVEGLAVLSGAVATVMRREFLTSLGALVAGTALTGGLLWIAL
jgi:hypothetical protein